MGADSRVVLSEEESLNAFKRLADASFLGAASSERSEAD
jgi:hypothetical protein